MSPTAVENLPDHLLVMIGRRQQMLLDQLREEIADVEEEHETYRAEIARRGLWWQMME